MTDSTGPVITTPDASVAGMVGPGQEHILEEFIQEQEQEQAQAQEPEKLLGKFNSTEDLAAAYQELERKLGQPKAQPEPSDEQSPPEEYTAEAVAGIYGADKVEALRERGIDMVELTRQADAGEDISEHYDALAETYNVSREMVDAYVRNATSQTESQSEGSVLTPADGIAIKNQFGGEEAFDQLGQWAEQNLSRQELDSYNAVVNRGDKDGIIWALKAIEARRSSPDAVVQPKLIGGSAPAQPVGFQSEQEVLDAMNKKNERGQRKYDVDPAYRDQVVQTLAQSNVF